MALLEPDVYFATVLPAWINAIYQFRWFSTIVSIEKAIAEYYRYFLDMRDSHIGVPYIGAPLYRGPSIYRDHVI